MKDRYGLVASPLGGRDLALLGSFLWVQYRFPEREIEELLTILRSGLRLGGWREKTDGTFTRGKMHFRYVRFRTHLRDERAGRWAPDDYGYLEVTFGERLALSPDEEKQVWTVLDAGIRQKGLRGDPQILESLPNIDPFLPAQLELGSGPSTELGVPPLRHLHTVYDLSDPTTGRFQLSAGDDRLLPAVTTDPEQFALFAGEICAKTVTVDLGTFYPLLPELYERRLLVGPVITHNFDGILRLLGIGFDMVRRYDEVYWEQYPLEPSAKSLLVVGLHADRRRIQAAARAAGKRVVHVNPEGFHVGGEFAPCPLEGPQNEDVVVRLTARTFASALRDVL